MLATVIVARDYMKSFVIAEISLILEAEGKLYGIPLHRSGFICTPSTIVVVE